MWTRMLLIAVLAGLLLGGLTTGVLHRNEGLRARLAWESFERGEWLVPTLYGEPHLTKPPGTSVLISLCSLPFGRIMPWTARLPSVLAGAVTIALVGWIVGRAFGSRAGWLAALILPCCPAWLDRVPSAEIDLVQLGWVTASLALLCRAVETDRFVWWLAALLCVTGGFFTKWTAPAFFYLTALPLLAWRGQLRLLLHRPHLLAASVALLLAVGWLVHVGRAVGWQPLLDTVSREALSRLSPGHHPRPYPWSELLTFPLGFVAMCLPWSLPAILAWRPGFADHFDDRQRLLWQLALAWAGSSLLFWTLVPGHRPRHVLPAQPAVALLAAMVCVTSLRWRFAARTAIVGWLVVKVVWVGFVLPHRYQNRDVPRIAAELTATIPRDQVLLVDQLKDECLAFYYDRPILRMRGLCGRRGEWWLLTEAERRLSHEGITIEKRLIDSQRQPIWLVRLARSCP